MTNLPLLKVVLCDFINPINDKKAELVREGALVFKRQSTGHYNFSYCGPSRKILEDLEKKRSIKVIDRKKFLALPAFFDIHFHWVQDEVRLMPKDNLLKWLKNYTWPYEQKFKSKSYSKARSKLFRDELLEVGTLGGAVYSSVHEHSTEHAIDNFIGDFVVGNVLMTMNSPSYMTIAKDKSLAIVRSLSKKHKKKYALTPRFAPTTHPDVMKKGVDAVRRFGSFIQTHLSETKNEIDYVLSLYKEFDDFKNVKTYTEIYEKVGLLTDRTIMGHGVYLTPSELKILADYKTAIAHCPTSNAPTSQMGLGSGLFDYKLANKQKVEWGLASDIGGGPYLSMFDVMNSFVSQNIKRGHKDTSFTQALFRSTLKNAEIMKVSSKTGSLSVGKEASFVLVESTTAIGGESSESVLKSIISQHKNNRECYQRLVFETYHQGSCVFKNNG